MIRYARFPPSFPYITDHDAPAATHHPTKHSPYSNSTNQQPQTTLSQSTPEPHSPLPPNPRHVIPSESTISFYTTSPARLHLRTHYLNSSKSQEKARTNSLLAPSAWRGWTQSSRASSRRRVRTRGTVNVSHDGRGAGIRRVLFVGFRMMRRKQGVCGVRL